MCTGEECSEDNTSDPLQPLSEDQCEAGWRQQHPPSTGQVSEDTGDEILNSISVTGIFFRTVLNFTSVNPPGHWCSSSQ